MNTAQAFARSLVTIAAAVSLSAQVRETPAAFEVASVKRTSRKTGRLTMAMRGGPGTEDPGRITYTGLPLRDLIGFAYGISGDRIECPGWLATERYDVLAKVPGGATIDSLKAMLQMLLKDRFGLVFHRKKRDLPTYLLLPGKSAPKMKASEAGSPAAADPSRAPGLVAMTINGRSRILGTGQSVAALSDALSRQLSRPVLDATGLTGAYDFTLEYLAQQTTNDIATIAPPSATAETQPPPNLFAAVRDQLGLGLEVRKQPTDVLVVDSIRKIPTEN